MASVSKSGDAALKSFLSFLCIVGSSCQADLYFCKGLELGAWRGWPFSSWPQYPRPLSPSFYCWHPVISILTQALNLDLSLNPISVTYCVCILGQINQPLWVLFCFYLSAKWEEWDLHYSIVMAIIMESAQLATGLAVEGQHKVAFMKSCYNIGRKGPYEALCGFQGWRSDFC